MNLTSRRIRLISNNKTALRETRTYVLVLMHSKLKWYNFRLIKLISNEIKQREVL
jgi:hypothetical protein|tara:strand:- start:188 stop:352 length:165 start_codon:yes stop_codon:yes gene_type:complete